MKQLQDVSEFSVGQLAALADRVGGPEAVKQVLRGEKEVVLKDVVRLLVDRNGRCIPVKPEITTAVCDPNSDFYFDRLPEDFDFGPAITAWEQLFQQSAGMNLPQFAAKIEAIKAAILVNPQISNLLVGPYFSIIVPQIPKADYGQWLEKALAAVQTAYQQAFPKWRFINYRKGELAGQITIVDERHKRLVNDLQQGPIVGILAFPLQGFSVFAQRQMAELMPDNISLAGPIEIGVAEAMFPQYLARDNNTPGKDCAAVQWRGSGDSLYFSAHGDKLEFGGGYNLGRAGASDSGALFVRG